MHFFNIWVLSQCIVYWIHFQNIHTFTYQKTLLHILFLLVFKIVESLIFTRGDLTLFHISLKTCRCHRWYYRISVQFFFATIYLSFSATHSGLSIILLSFSATHSGSPARVLYHWFHNNLQKNWILLYTGGTF